MTLRRERSKLKTIIHVGQQTIAQNRRDGTTNPPLIARTYKGAKRAQTVEILDKDGEVVGRFVYRPHNPLPCGARLWFETENEVRLSQ